MTAHLRVEAEQHVLALKDVIRRFVACCPDGATNAEVAKELGLESRGTTGHKNYVTHSLLAALVREGSMSLEKRGRNTVFKAR